MIGSLRARFADLPRRSSQSEKYPAEHHADRRGDERHDREEADLQPAHVALGREIGREPGQEEHQRRVARELAEADACELALLQQLAGHAPAEFRLLGPVVLLRVVREAAARFDVFELLLVRARMVARLMVELPPDQAERHADAADHPEQRAPAERAHQREQHRAEEREADVLADRIGAGRHCALVLREPRRDHPAVGREARRLRDAEAQPAREQRRDAGYEALQQRAQRPQRHRPVIGDLAAEAVEEEAARHLHRDIGPRERGEHDAHHRRVDAELLGELRRSHPSTVRSR